MGNKYGKKLHPIVAKCVGASHVWKKMVAMRDEIEHKIWWQVKAGNSSFWFDNWTKQGALYFTEGESTMEEEIEVKEFFENGIWKIDKLREFISEEMTEYIIENIKPGMTETLDKAWWMGNSTGEFTVKSAYHLVRHKRDKIEWNNCMWLKCLSFKISFFIWRVWKKRIVTDDNLKRMRMNIVSKYYCCDSGEMKTMTHLLLTAPIAQRLWKQFASCAGIIIGGQQLHKLIFQWWEYDGNPKVQHIMKAIPAIVMWELWKRMNAKRHDKEISFNKMYSQCQLTVHQLIRAKYPWLRNVPYHWAGMIDLLQNYKLNLWAGMIDLLQNYKLNLYFRIVK
ncbi:hypothetical protein KY290_005464 [Solanum tuberosum]|uniref:Reverse transcriptase zinc-binding domain-containing protein n=1 Tax=Solanum tuberosum TaxID=4113 RepID=A0ABQ7WE76_SOLTU|nr:hypothetical protein KY290_005464 [Solanum tuberosum]